MNINTIKLLKIIRKKCCVYLFIKTSYSVIIKYGDKMINKIYEKVRNFIKVNYKFLVFFAILIFMFYYEFPYIIYKSGGTIDLGNRVKV